jgi:2-(1,2-epoxy-1,2-dihydrophenyl)acetyl-CoA isomerase
MSYEALNLERSGHIAILTLNRPEKLNALNQQLTQEFHAALDEVAGEFPDIRVLIITGAGRGFCSGADVGDQAEALSQPQNQGPPKYDTEAAFNESILALGPHVPQIPQPVIAAVNGVAAGAGLSIALASDIRVASDQARFSCIFVKRSLVPDNGASYFLPALAGMGVAAEMALTGRVYDAPWALQVGLVNTVVPAEQLMEQAKSLAQEIASNPPLAVRATKQLLTSQVSDLYRVARAEYEANEPFRYGEDRREAILSFLEKRQPVYKGK